MRRRLCLHHTVAAVAGCAGWAPLLAGAAEPADPSEGDPFKSMQWPELRKQHLGATARTRFDARVRVLGPAFAEDPMNVPITVSADLPGVQRLIVLVDRNPIRKVLELQPLTALPAMSFRFKLEQASPVRALALTADGVWHVGGTWVDSTGGGCTVAGGSRVDGSWTQTLGQVTGRMYAAGLQSTADGASTARTFEPASASAVRLRLRIMHPMDTGLVGGIPAFFVSRLAVRDAADRELLRIQTFEPISENPVFSFEFAQAPAGPLRIVGVDNNGNRIDSQVQ